jgi:hypothetical protein
MGKRGIRWSVEQYDAYIRNQQSITETRHDDDLPRHEKIKKTKLKDDYEKESAREQRRIMKKYTRPNNGFKFCTSTFNPSSK